MAQGGQSVAQMEKAMKIIYKNGVEGCDYESSKFLARLPRSGEFKGLEYDVTIKFARGQGGSSQFSVAQSGISPTRYTRFRLPRKKYYWLCRIDNETMDAADGNMGSVINAGKEEITGARDEFVRYMGILSNGDGTGAVGRISLTAGVVTGTTITLNDPASVIFFQPDMQIVFTTNGTAPVGGLQEVTITRVNELAGQIEVDLDLDATVIGIAAGNYIHRKGDVGNIPMGWQGYVGNYVPGTSLPGVLYDCDRDVYPTRLGGYPFDCSNGAIADKLIDGFQLHARGAVSGADVLMNSVDMGTFLKECAAAGWRTDRAEIATKVAGVSYEGITVFTPAGKKTIMDDPNIPSGIAGSFNFKNWELRTLGPFPKLLNRANGQTWYMLQNEDMWEARLGMYGNIALDNPGNQAKYYNLGQ